MRKHVGRSRLLSGAVLLTATAIAVVGCSSGSGVQSSSTGAQSPAASSGGPASSTPGGGDQPGSSAAQSLTKINFLTDFTMNGVHAGIWYGISQGYYKDAGIDLNLIYGTGSATTAQQIAAGKVDMGDVFSGSLVQAIANGAPLKSVGYYRAEGGFAFFCDKKLNITTYEQLKGHSVILPPGTVQGTLYVGALRAAGLTENDIKPLSVEAKTALSVYGGGQADCISTTVGDAPTFQTQRPSTTLLWRTGGFVLPGFAFVVSDDYYNKNQDLIKRFLTATYKSISEGLKHPDDALAAFLKGNPDANPTLSKAQWTVSLKVFCTEEMVQNKLVIGDQLPASWVTVVDAVSKYQGLPKKVDPTSVYTDQFFDQGVSSTVCEPSMTGAV